MHADESRAQVLAQDSGLLLALEIGINHGHRPTRRGTAGDDTVLAAVEAEVLHFVTDVPDSCQGVVSQVEIQVVEETVLGEMSPDGHGLRIALADPEIDVGQGTIEGAGVGVGRALALAGNATGEPDHIVPFILETGCLVGQVDDGTLPAVSDQADIGGNHDGLRHPVLTFRKVQDAEAELGLDVIDGLLEGIRDVRFPVCLEPVVLRREIEGARILRTEGIDGTGCGLLRGEGREECDRQQKDA